ncbi:hypothetical protein Misp01_44420 [Microtetraspora sp. NBRC 13810]|uniref:serine/threonine-protein kinase n=1 Tax=Microtetraspora sp. NBRC 13810 TaxID=3030990 RepID=UPI0024A3918F|nr:serine/threonine protein kinase [Microtetraspora sp. NBRC 13810]GLW09313.1 hypothetical protein Misp01_44420 [Microtetraspora sp. NBRC 13810]
MAGGGTGPKNGMPPGVRPLTVGDPVIIGRYLLLGRLGTGGMGVVYLAEHPEGGLVALKTPHAVHLGDPVLRARFTEEVAFSQRVVPFCTAAVVEDGAGRERPHLVTEYIPGPALSEVVTARGPLTADLAYGVALGVAAALSAVHEAGLVHRDLKPGNVLLSPRGPRLIDFGIARDLTGYPDPAAAHTQAGQVMGSPGWVAPERLTGGLAVPASDVFSWGCVVAYAVTGHHPFGSGEPDVVTRRIMVEPPRLTGVPALLTPAVRAALDKDPAARPGAADLLGALLAAGGVGAPGDPREAVAAVMEELWAPVPYPAARVRPASGGGPGPRDERTGPGAREERTGGRRGREERTGGKRARRRPAHLSHASFAALATVSIAAVTVIAASGGATLGETGREAAPYAVTPDGTALSTARPAETGPPGSSFAPAPVAGRRSPPAAVVITTRRTQGEPPYTTPHGTWSAPPPPQESAPQRPDPVPTDEEVCLNRKGKPRPCPSATRTRPRPSGGITTEPQWGGGESPSPTPTDTTVPTTPATTESATS